MQLHVVLATKYRARVQVAVSVHYVGQFWLLKDVKLLNIGATLL